MQWVFFSGSSVHVVADDNNVIQAIFFQDQEMKNMFRAFPEVIFVDSTYRTNNTQMAMYVLLVEDGNGESEIVAVWFLRDETADVVTTAVNTFCTDNPESEKVKLIMADKDFVERDAFSAAFPDAAIQICFFHTLRTFRREITAEKLSITSAQRDKALDFLQRLAYSRSEQQYQSVYNDFVMSAPPSVVQYFNRNWHDIRVQWVRGIMSSAANYGNFTNNRLESINQKLKSVMSSQCTFAECVSSLKAVIGTLRSERNHRAILMIQKKVVTQ